MRKVELLLITLCIFFAAACRKDPPRLPLPKTDVDPEKIIKLPVTTEEIILVENLKNTTEVLQELYKQRDNLKLVNASIFAKAYTDESILLKDLIYPEKSRLKENASFKKYSSKWNLSLDQFARNFWNEAGKRNDPDFLAFLHGLEPAGTNMRAADGSEGSGDVSIYFPYSVEYFPPEEGSYAPITTLVTATADADEGWGSQPYYVNGVLQSYVPVLVNDEYAANNPTQIVGVNGIEPYEIPASTNTIFPPGNATDLPDLTREVKQVYIGEVAIHDKQFDSFISFTGNGGGSEIRFTRADGFLKVVDGQVQLADVYFTPAQVISRHDIKKENFVDFSLEWDGDWELANLQQNLGIYEEDNRNSSTFTGSLTTTVTAALTPIKVEVARALGFTINFKSDDELIRQINFHRDVFFVLNRTNLEGEMRNGWPVRDRRGLVSYTLADRTYH